MAGNVMPTKSEVLDERELTKTDNTGDVELDEKELKRVTGGMSISYAKVETGYKPQKPDGSL